MSNSQLLSVEDIRGTLKKMKLVAGGTSAEAAIAAANCEIRQRAQR
jgi:hypothetical protein